MVRKTFSLLAILILIPFFFVQNCLCAQSVGINEVMAANVTDITDEDGDREDWIELFNYGSTPINLAGYGLSDNFDQPFKWVFPSVVIDPGGFLLVWASGKNRTESVLNLHANFSISASGEEIILTGTDGALLDELLATSIPSDHTYGRYPDGTGEWFYYTETTPNAPNSSSTTIHPPEPPVFSVTSGFFSEEFTLTLTHPHPEATIIYTLDGSNPMAENILGISYEYKNQYPQDAGQEFGPLLTNSYTSSIYSDPLIIIDRSSEPNKLSNISSTWHYSPDYLPSKPIKKASVIRAIAIVDGVSSEIESQTYFVSDNRAFESHLPIASISLSEDALFDYYDGIYVAGKDFDNWRENNAQGVTNGHRPANYRRSGDETEKSACFQYFVGGQEVLNQNVGLSLHGAFSRSAQNKTFRLYARSEYDSDNSFDYPFFGLGNSGSFKRLLLRNSGNDAGNVWIGNALVPTISPAVYFRDAFIQKMVSHLRFDTQDYVPVITYVNGEYWGLLNLRERYDRHYLERRYGIDENDLDYLDGNASVKEGSNAHYLRMRDFISNNNLAIDENYQYVKTLMDTDNFMDYQISQIYARNTDWPGNNIDYFRKKTDQYLPDAPYGQDGRWRWLMYDTDHGFGWSGGNSFTHNTLNGASNDNSWAKIILRKLLENPEFRNGFINRYADLLNSAFLPERLLDLISEMATRIADEIPLHRERWNTLHNWEEHVDLMSEFAERRPDYARAHIVSRFNLSGTYKATLSVSDADHGYIRINTIDISEKTPGIPANSYPWTGIYFKQIPISVSAIPNPGYKFSHWSGVNTSSDAVIGLTPDNDFTLQAHFVPIETENQDLIYFWLMDASIGNNIPLQQINSTWSGSGAPATLQFLSSFGPDYPFTDGHPNWRKGSMERRNSPTPLNYYPAANNNIEFGSLDMRGLQVKEPFLSNDFENTLFLKFSTENFKNIQLSFAAKDEGAAQQLIIDYYDPASESWDNTGLINSNIHLSSDYQQCHVDFSFVAMATDHADFRVRIRFAGTDMTKDNGNRVTFNNIAITGRPLASTNLDKEAIEKKDLVSVFPNPFTDQMMIQTGPSLHETVFNVYDLKGNRICSGILNEKFTKLNLEHIAAGFYVLKIGNENVKILKVGKD